MDTDFSTGTAGKRSVQLVYKGFKNVARFHGANTLEISWGLLSERIAYIGLNALSACQYRHVPIFLIFLGRFCCQRISRPPPGVVFPSTNLIEAVEAVKQQFRPRYIELLNIIEELAIQGRAA